MRLAWAPARAEQLGTLMGGATNLVVVPGLSGTKTLRRRNGRRWPTSPTSALPIIPFVPAWVAWASVGDIARQGHSSRGALFQPASHGAADDGAQDPRHPEEPDLAQRRRAAKQGAPQAARRIDGSVGDRDSNDMDGCQRQTDGNRRETGRGAFRRGADDHDQEEGGEHRFDQKHG